MSLSTVVLGFQHTAHRKDGHMDSQFDLRDLQRSANRIMVRNKLKPSGISAIVFGLLALSGAWGATSTRDIALGLIGLFLVFEGIWLLLWPSAYGVLLNGIGIAAVGVFNISGFLIPGSRSSWPILGLLQLRWAYDRFREYKLFRAITAQDPSPEADRFMEALVKDVDSREVESCADTIGLKYKGVDYKAILMERSAVLVSTGCRVILVWNRRDLDMVRGENTADGSIQVSGGSLGDSTATMSQMSFARYAAWKHEEPLPPTAVTVRRSLKPATKVMISVVSTLLFALLAITVLSVVSAKHALLSIILIAISAGPLVAWNSLSKMREWAWWTLVVVESMAILGLIMLIGLRLFLVSTGSAARVMTPAGFAIVFALLTVFSVPLCMLLIDRPSSWRRIETIPTQQPVPPLDLVSQ